MHQPRLVGVEPAHPLTAVREGAELLRDNVGGKLTPEQREIVGIVRQRVRALRPRVDVLLVGDDAALFAQLASKGGLTGEVAVVVPGTARTS